MIRRSILLGVFILSFPISVMAAETGNGKIEGRIVNGTAASGNVSNQDVALKTTLNGAEAGSATTRTDAEGRFVFNNLATDSSYSYQVTLKFQEADYTSGNFTFAANETTKSVKVTVYDSTMSDEAIKVDVAHTVIYAGQGSLRVEEYFTFVNESDRTYIGSGEITTTGTRRTLKFSLPDGSSGLQYGGEFMECCVLSDEGGLTDTMAVLPGSKELIFAYTVDYRSNQYPFSLVMNYPTASHNFLVQGGDAEITQGQLTRHEPVTIGDKTFNYFTGDNITAGETLVAQLIGLPQAANQTAVIWVALTVLALGATASFLYLRRQRTAPATTAGGSPAQRRQRLLAELARLDDDFENGKIAEDVYQRRRAERKGHLVKLMPRSKGESGNR